MGNLLYAIAAFLVIVWAIAFLEYNAPATTHILLVMALVFALLRIVPERNYRRKINSKYLN